MLAQIAGPELWAQSSVCHLSNLSILVATRYRIAVGRRRLNPAFALSGASSSPSSDGRRRGVLYAELREIHPDRLVVGETVLYLTDGIGCPYPTGSFLEILYTERDGRRNVDSIKPAKAPHLGEPEGTTVEGAPGSSPSRPISSSLSPKMLAVVQKVEAAEAEALAALRERATQDAERRRAARREQAGKRPAITKRPLPPPRPIA